MSFDTTYAVTLSTDEEGYVGRECPKTECEGCFKIRTGTGLKGKDLPCSCPYCGHRSLRIRLARAL
jgi:Zn finger protein HypA/HybF involved in hydrogenase expression